MERPPRRPPLDFNHLIECFARFFDGGFESQDFQERERGYKEEAADVLKDKLGKDAFESLLGDRNYVEVCAIAKHVVRGANLVFRIDKAKFTDAIDNVAHQERFANTLFELLHGSAEIEQRFTKFCGLLSEIGVNQWTVATYY